MDYSCVSLKMPLNVSTVDFKTSHSTHSFPGFVNVSAFVPRLLSDKQSVSELTQASLRGGFTTSMFLPLGSKEAIQDEASLFKAQSIASGAAHCNYTLSIVASSSNPHMMREVQKVLIPFSFPSTRRSLFSQCRNNWRLLWLTLLLGLKGSPL